MSDMSPRVELDKHGRPWAAVASIAAATFVLVTTEFLPIGLLSRIAADLHVSEGTAGLAVTAPGLAATFAAPALVIAARRIDRRTVMVVLTLAITASSLICVVAPDFLASAVTCLIGAMVAAGLKRTSLPKSCPECRLGDAL